MRKVQVWKLLLLFVFVFCAVSAAGAFEWSKIIDDGDEGYSETSPYGAWRSWSFPGAVNGDWRYLSGLYELPGGPVPRRGKAYWKTTVPVSGSYEVAVHFFHTENRTNDADYFIEDGNGRTHHFVLNQRSLPTGWYVLGTFEWKKNQVSTVILDGTDDDQSDEADAVRWILKEESTESVVPANSLLLGK